MEFTLGTLLTQLGLPVPQQKADTLITAIKPLDEAGPTDLSFLESPQFYAAAKTTRAGAVFARAADITHLPSTTIALVTNHPYTAFARALQLMYPDIPPQPGISQFAVVSGSATIDPTARIEPYAVIYAGARIGAGAHIGAHAVIGEGCTVGTGTRVGAHVTLSKTEVGAGCIIHPGARLGQDGFGFAVSPGPDGQPLITKVPQIGRVVVGNNVEIGANCTIDCGALGNTVIEDHAKIDNLVQVGHNVRIGHGSRIVAQTGIAGSANLGKFTLIGGQAGIAGHLDIADRTMVAGRSGVTKSVEKPGSVLGGVPAVPINEWRRQVATLARMAKNIRQRPPQTGPKGPSNSEFRIPSSHPTSMVPPAAESSADDTETPTALDPNTGNPFA